MEVKCLQRWRFVLMVHAGEHRVEKGKKPEWKRRQRWPDCPLPSQGSDAAEAETSASVLVDLTFVSFGKEK